jgi:hypothetical protein
MYHIVACDCDRGGERSFNIPFVKFNEEMAIQFTNDTF